MLWVTYRQFRTTLFATLSVVALVAVLTLIFSWVLRGENSVSSFGTFYPCFGEPGAVCAAQTILTATTLTTVALPVLAGLFVGVTVFSRDIERGTHVLALSQSASRTSWYISRVVVVFVPVVVAMIALGLVFTWARSMNATPNWQIAMSTINSRFAYPMFETSALMPGAYAAVALMLGALLALLVRNTILAMVLTLVASVGLLILVSAGIRQYYATPQIETLTVDSAVEGMQYTLDLQSPRWTVDRNYVDAESRTVTIDYDACPTDDEAFWNETNQRPDETYTEWDARSTVMYAERNSEVAQCIRSQGAVSYEIAYHEDSTFWRFQLTEAALALALSIALGAGSLVLVRRLRP